MPDIPAQPLIEKINGRLADLKKSRFRSKFRLTAKDISYIDDKGPDTIRSHAQDFITRRIAPALPANDGRQTPIKNHPVFIAQHATACCCRRCLAKWHGIPKGQPLSRADIDYLVELIMAWIKKQSPD